MSIYTAMETGIVTVIVLISACYVFKLFMPEFTRRVGALVAKRLKRPEHADSSGILAGQSQAAPLPSACASGCNGCAMAPRNSTGSAQGAVSRRC